MKCQDANSLMPVVQWLIYQPTYSCRPPPLVLVFLSVLQVYELYVFYTVSLLIYQPTYSSRPPPLVLVFLSVYTDTGMSVNLSTDLQL